VDVLAYAEPKDKTQIGLEIHSGRNRIVRRIFEHLGYDVRGLDRVMYAGLTKKNVQRGHWRLLTEKEIRILKYLNSSFRGSLAAPKSHAATEAEIPEKPAAPAAIAPKKFKKPQAPGWSKERRPSGKSRSARPAAPANDLRGRKSSGSYIKSKAKSQQATGRSQQATARSQQATGKSHQASGAKSPGARSPRPPKSSRRPH
jgi:hypothetical protein